MTTKTETLENLNEFDAPKTLGLELLADDGQGHQCWAVRSGAVCYRLARNETDGGCEWTDDVSGWDA